MLQCRCGTLKGYVSQPGSVNRAVCYCRDCQAFAHFLGRANEILDSKGGSDVVQTTPLRVTFTDGVEMLACMRLSEWPNALVCQVLQHSHRQHGRQFQGVLRRLGSQLFG